MKKIFSKQTMLGCLICFAITTVICIICGAAYIASSDSPHLLIVCGIVFSVIMYFVRTYIKKKTDCSTLMSVYIGSGGIISVGVLLIGTFVLSALDGGFNGWGFVIGIIAVMVWAITEGICMGLSLAIEALVKLIGKNKKVLYAFLAAAALAVSGCAAFFWGTGITPESSFEYSMTADNKITVTKYKGPYLNVHIPETIEGRPVTKIGNDAFSDNNFLLSVYVPDSVTELEGRCFSYSNYLSKVRLSENITIIPKGCFMCCKRLSSINIPSAVEEIGDFSFESCEGLRHLTFAPESKLKKIGENAFCYNYSLESVSLPDSLTYLDEEAFYDCKKLSEAHLGNYITYIGPRNFCNCALKAPVEVPPTIEKIGNEAFEETGFICDGREYHAANGFSGFYRNDNGDLTDDQITPQKK